MKSQCMKISYIMWIGGNDGGGGGDDDNDDDDDFTSKGQGSPGGYGVIWKS